MAKRRMWILCGRSRCTPPTSQNRRSRWLVVCASRVRGAELPHLGERLVGRAGDLDHLAGQRNALASGVLRDHAVAPPAAPLVLRQVGLGDGVRGERVVEERRDGRVHLAHVEEKAARGGVHGAVGEALHQTDVTGAPPARLGRDLGARPAQGEGEDDALHGGVAGVDAVVQTRGGDNSRIGSCSF